MFKTNYFFVNLTTPTEKIPVRIEQCASSSITYITKDILELFKDSVSGYYNIYPGMAYVFKHPATKSEYISASLIDFWRTILQFKSKVKGVVKLRAAFSSNNNYKTCLDTESNILLHYINSTNGFSGITMNMNTTSILYNILKEQNQRWQKIKTKYSKPIDQINRFLDITTGQHDIYSNKIMLWLCLEHMQDRLYDFELQSDLQKLNFIDIDDQIKFNKLYYSSDMNFRLTTKDFHKYKLDKLGFIFYKAKKLLTNLVETFTKNTTEIKFIYKNGYVKS